MKVKEFLNIIRKSGNFNSYILTQDNFVCADSFYRKTIDDTNFPEESQEKIDGQLFLLEQKVIKIAYELDEFEGTSDKGVFLNKEQQVYITIPILKKEFNKAINKLYPNSQKDEKIRIYQETVKKANKKKAAKKKTTTF